MTRRAFLVYTVLRIYNIAASQISSSAPNFPQRPFIIFVVHFSIFTEKSNGFYRFSLFGHFEFLRFLKIDVAQTLVYKLDVFGPLLKLRPDSKSYNIVFSCVYVSSGLFGTSKYFSRIRYYTMNLR